MQPNQLPIETYLPAQYYAPVDFRFVAAALLALILLIILVTLAVVGSIPFGLGTTTPKTGTAELLAALADKANPLHQILQAQVQDAVKKALRRMQDELASAIETVDHNEAAVAAMEVGMKNLWGQLATLQRLQAAQSAAQDAADDLPAASPAPLSPRPVYSRASSTSQDLSDIDSIYGSEGSQKTAPAPSHQLEPPEMSQDFDNELAELGGWDGEEDAKGEMNEEEEEGEEEDENEDEDEDEDEDEEEAEVVSEPAPPARMPLAQLPGIGALVPGRPIRPLSSLKTRGTRGNAAS